jgi:hypothetical protein
MERLEGRTLFAVFTVTSTADAGPGSLRQVILDVNASPGADEVQFAIPGAGIHTIAPASPLPEATGAVTIDATTQPGYAGFPKIELDGSAAGATTNGLMVRGAAPFTGIVVRGLSVNRFGGNGIVVSGAYVSLAANHVGISPAGDAARPNGMAGVLVQGSDVVIGGTSPAQRNVISGNTGPGIRLASNVSNFASKVTIVGNFIGTDATGGTLVGNGEEGIHLAGTFDAYTRIGRVGIGGTAPGAGNVISGNGASGVRVSFCYVCTIEGNLIGTDASGGRPLGNGRSATATYRDGITAVDQGIEKIGGNTPAARNVISANAGAGIRMTDGEYAQIQGNFIGTDLQGVSDLGNGSDGIVLSKDPRSWGRHADVVGNLISGNGGDGFHAVDVIAEVYNNYIGTNAKGDAAIGNDGDGMDLFDAHVQVGNGNGPASPPPVIDPGGRGRNIISANGGQGIRFGMARSAADALIVRDNYIGTDVTGNLALGNRGSGLYLTSHGFGIGGWGYGNVISANGGDGIAVVGVAAPGRRHLIQGNFIGTNAAGAGLGNAGHGIAILNSSEIVVGGIFPSSRSVFTNTIAFNGGSGVQISGAASGRNRVTSNLIFSNGGLEIDLGGDGVTPNDAGDADSGANRLVNFPVITEVRGVPASNLPTRSAVRFTLSAEPLKTYEIEFFSDPAPDPSGHGGGAVLLGDYRVTTDAAGNATAERLVNPATVGDFVSAIATDANGNSSEFSAAVRAAPQEIYGRYVFYNRSGYDGRGPGADARDDRAIAPDTYPIVPRRGSPFSNITSYGSGINGIMIDVARLPEGAALTAADFDFRAGPGDNAAAWKDAPDPSIVAVRRGAGIGGSDRITLIWPDYGMGNPGQAVANAWLQVTIKATSATGLSSADVFYFGNLIGYNSADTKVNADDLAYLRRNIGKPWEPFHRWYDHNQDGVLNARDMAILRSNYGRSLALLTAKPETAPASSIVAMAEGVRTSVRRRVSYLLEA